ncbi:TIGR00730 family Rossman fold protein [Niveibacterium terrae]|uniref:LOG family protein n=1 Tax=Niveibacterium terrae TaxID=3373598 RepID=UPI003A8F35EC
MRSLCVFCGSSVGNHQDYALLARQLGGCLAEAGITLVYGGGKVGLMGAVADATLAAGGRVLGVMPEHLVKQEIAHTGLSELHVVASMHERKEKMAALSDGFIALPGGAGTFEELFEQWTWAQLGIHEKPCALLNAKGYFQPLLAMIGGMVAEGFMRSAYRDMLIVSEQPATLIELMENYLPPPPKWAK